MGAAVPPLRGGGSWVPISHNVAWDEAYLCTKWHLDPYSHFATTDMDRKLGGCASLGEGELGPHRTQCGQAEAYLHAKFHLDPSNRLATVHQRYRETDRQDRTTVR